MRLLGEVADRDRVELLRYLAELGNKVLPVLPDILPYLDPIKPKQFSRACEVVANIGLNAMPAIEVLQSSLSNDNGLVRREAIKALGKLGTISESVCDDLRFIARDPEEGRLLRDLAGEAITSIGCYR